MKEKVKTTERGWAGHFICADNCRFHRNTLIEYKNKKIVVSSVGAYIPRDKKEPSIIGRHRYYETMVFLADGTIYQDADPSEELELDFPKDFEPWDEINANNIHDRMVRKWKKKIKEI